MNAPRIGVEGILSRNKKKRSIRVVEYYFFAGVAGAALVPNNLLQKPGPVKVFNTDRTSSPLASSSIYEIEIEPFVREDVDVRKPGRRRFRPSAGLRFDVAGRGSSSVTCGPRPLEVE